MARIPALSLKKLTQKKFKTMDFQGEFKDLIGTPECSGAWLIYGGSGNGKTTFALQLMKYLCGFKKCAYIPLEQKDSLSFQDAIKRANLLSVNTNVKIWLERTFDDLTEELFLPKSPDIIFIDSLQYLRKNKKTSNELTRFEFKELIDLFPRKLFIFVSHEKNGEPKGALGDSAYYFSDVCLRLVDFNVTPVKSRYGGDTQYQIQKTL